MTLFDLPEAGRLPLPPDRLNDKTRMTRLFSGLEDRWRLLAVLTLGEIPSNLVKPELRALARDFGDRGLVIRIVFIGDENLRQLDEELSFWTDECIIATGDNIHARRCLKDERMPCAKLYSPEGSLAAEMNGFDTEDGLDVFVRALAPRISVPANGYA